MEEYKEKFLMLFRETSKAIRVLSDVRRECLDTIIAIAEEKMDEENAQE